MVKAFGSIDLPWAAALLIVPNNFLLHPNPIHTLTNKYDSTIFWVESNAVDPSERYSINSKTRSFQNVKKKKLFHTHTKKKVSKSKDGAYQTKLHLLSLTRGKTEYGCIPGWSLPLTALPWTDVSWTMCKGYWLYRSGIE